MIRYRSPASGRPLQPDSAHSLSDGRSERWPVVDGIAYLRAGSEALAAAVLKRLDSGDRAGALVLLLAENDRWWTEPPPPPEDLRRLIEGKDELSLREAMRLLGWGRVGDYFAHRWDVELVGLLALADHRLPRLKPLLAPLQPLQRIPLGKGQRQVLRQAKFERAGHGEHVLLPARPVKQGRDGGVGVCQTST